MGGFGVENHPKQKERDKERERERERESERESEREREMSLGCFAWKGSFACTIPPKMDSKQQAQPRNVARFFPSTYPGSLHPTLHAILEAFWQPEPHVIFRAPILGLPCQYYMRYGRRFCSSSSTGFSEHLSGVFPANVACLVGGNFAA